MSTPHIDSPVPSPKQRPCRQACVYFTPHGLTSPLLRRTSCLALAPVTAPKHKSSNKTLPAGLCLLHPTSSHQSPTATYKSPSASVSHCFYAQVVNQDPACGLDSTPFHIDSTVPNCRHHRHRLHWLWSTKTHSSSATGQPPQPGLSKTPPSRTHGHTHNNFAISIGL